MKQLKLGFNEINLLGDYDAAEVIDEGKFKHKTCLLYTSPSPRDRG